MIRLFDNVLYFHDKNICYYRLIMFDIDEVFRQKRVGRKREKLLENGNV